MPFDPENAFAPADPSQWLRTRALPHIIVHPKQPPGTPADNSPGSDGIDDWFVPGSASDGPDDWFVPTPSAAPNVGQRAPGPLPANPGVANPPAAAPDPLADYWSLIPASRAGAMAWAPPIFLPPDPFAPENIPASKWLTPLPIFLGDSPTFSPNASTTSVWPPAPSPLAGGPNTWPSGGILGALANLGSSSPGPRGLLGALAHLGSSSPGPGGLLGALAHLGSSSPGPGGLLGALAHLGSSTPGPGGLLGALAQLESSSSAPAGSFPSPPQSATVPAVSPLGRSPSEDYSTGDIVGDVAKSFGVGMGRFGVHAAGSLGDAREMVANGVQQAADYFAPGFAPNAGSKASEYLASYPLLAGPTSSQLQGAVESFTGPFYQPKTIYGDYAQTAGEFVPGALLMPEGSLATNALRYGLLPALSSETAGQLTKGTAAEPWARTAGAILGAAPGAWRHLQWARSAPEVAETLAESQLSPAEALAARRQAQLEVNKAAGAAFENATEATLRQEEDIEFARQITAELPSGARVRIDFVTQNRVTGEIKCLECKSSPTAPVTSDQTMAFREMEQSPATIMGKGKPGFPGGMKIPPTRVEIRRPGN